MVSHPDWFETDWIACNRGKSYSQDQIDQIFRCRPTADNAELLASRFGRTPWAIDMVWRWADQTANFPSGARNRIVRQIGDARRRLGASVQGTMDLN